METNNHSVDEIGKNERDVDYPILLEEIVVAYYKCRRYKRNTLNALEFEVNFQKHLVNLWRELNAKQYKPSRSIAFLVHYPKLREVFAADFRDRVVHHLIMGKLEPLFEKVLIEDTYGCRKGKGTQFGVRRLNEKMNDITKNYTEEAWIGKFDLSGFFMSINKIILHKMLKRFITENYDRPDKNHLLYLVRKTVEHKPQDNCILKTDPREWEELNPSKSLFTCNPNCGLPIGNLTSQHFANFYLNEFDHWMSEMFGGYYGRYVDDFYVMARTEGEITKRIKLIESYLLDNLGLVLHKEKRYIQKACRGVVFVGSSVKHGKIRLMRKGLTRAYKTIHRYNTKVPVTTESLERLRNSLNSYLGFLRNDDSKKRRRQLWMRLDQDKWVVPGYLTIDDDYTVVKIKKEYTKKYQDMKRMKSERKKRYDDIMSGQYFIDAGLFLA